MNDPRETARRDEPGAREAAGPGRTLGLAFFVVLFGAYVLMLMLRHWE